jgi:hypothetical protein
MIGELVMHSGIDGHIVSHVWLRGEERVARSRLSPPVRDPPCPAGFRQRLAARLSARAMELPRSQAVHDYGFAHVYLGAGTQAEGLTHLAETASVKKGFDRVVIGRRVPAERDRNCREGDVSAPPRGGRDTRVIA